MKRGSVAEAPTTEAVLNLEEEERKEKKERKEAFLCLLSFFSLFFYLLIFERSI